MLNINKDIKSKEFKKVYLLTGEEDYLIKQYRDKLKENIIGDDGMNYSYFEGNNISAEEVIAIAQTLPFFAPKRLVIVENSNWFKSPKDSIFEFIKEQPESVIFVFVEKEIDKRGKLYKKIKENGYVSEMNTPNPETLLKWIFSKLDENAIKISRPDLEYFLSVVGDDMTVLSIELEKLISYVYEKKIVTKEDIDQICIHSITGRIFDMIDSMGNKEGTKALERYYELIELKEPPLKILYMLARQFNIMLRVSELIKNNYSSKDIAEKIPLMPFIVNKVLRQLNNFTSNDLKMALFDILETEQSIKSGNLNEKIGVELILIKYSKKNPEYK